MRIASLGAVLLLTSWAPAATGGPSSDPLTDDLALASLSEEGIKGNDHSRSVRLTADGSMVVFHSFASNLHPDDTDTIGDIYRKGVETGQLVLASTSDDGTKGNGTSLDPTVSSDGGMVAFWSLATNLDPADDDATADSYVKD